MTQTCSVGELDDSALSQPASRVVIQAIEAHDFRQALHVTVVPANQLGHSLPRGQSGRVERRPARRRDRGQPAGPTCAGPTCAGPTCAGATCDGATCDGEAGSGLGPCSRGHAVRVVTGPVRVERAARSSGPGDRRRASASGGHRSRPRVRRDRGPRWPPATRPGSRGTRARHPRARATCTAKGPGACGDASRTPRNAHVAFRGAAADERSAS